MEGQAARLTRFAVLIGFFGMNLYAVHHGVPWGGRRVLLCAAAAAACGALVMLIWGRKQAP
jgi:hypothetical protein